MTKLRLKTYDMVYTDKGRILPVAIMNQYGHIFETKLVPIGKKGKYKTIHVPTGECGSANH